MVKDIQYRIPIALKMLLQSLVPTCLSRRDRVVSGSADRSQLEKVMVAGGMCCPLDCQGKVSILVK